MKAKQAGFTLVEIAIVLVIIGLLLGGVLKGQELITQAKIKNVASDMTGIAAASYAYQDRYRAFAGDDSKADTRGWTGAAKGDGDGIVQGAFDTATKADESWLFWSHLRFAGLITGNPDEGQPKNPFGGVIGVQNGAPKLAGLLVCASQLPGKVASALDSQFDDGLPNKGQVLGFDDITKVSGMGVSDPATGITAYTDAADKTYVVCKPL